MFSEHITQYIYISLHRVKNCLLKSQPGDGYGHKVKNIAGPVPGQ